MRQHRPASNRLDVFLGVVFTLVLSATLPAESVFPQVPFPQVPEESLDAASDSGAAALQASRKHRKRQKRPIRMGTSGGSVESFTVSSPDVYCCGGTLGALLMKEDRYFILSNNHVLGRLNQAQVGEDVIQPGLNDANCNAPRRNLVASFSDFKKLKLQGTNRVDAAIAETSAESVAIDGKIVGIGVPGSGVVKPRIGVAVVKSGRTTGVTRGEVSATNVSGFVSFPEECGSESEHRVRFAKTFLVTQTGSKPFSDGGDSGSVIYEDVESCPRAMGLLFAGTSEFTAANPMNLVMKAVKKMRPKGKAELVGCSPAAALRSVASSLDREERSAMRTQRRMEERILSMPGVVAIGIGRSSVRTDEISFKVFLEGSAPGIAALVPDSLEGIPVEVVVSGELRALSCDSESQLAPRRGGLEAIAAR